MHGEARYLALQQNLFSVEYGHILLGNDSLQWRRLLSKCNLYGKVESFYAPYSLKSFVEMYLSFFLMMPVWFLVCLFVFYPYIDLYSNACLVWGLASDFMISINILCRKSGLQIVWTHEKRCSCCENSKEHAQIPSPQDLQSASAFCSCFANRFKGNDCSKWI